ncbi:MAG: hypothetical protein K2X27_24235 [Candidatus Obscuribacterales bacterium]|nr:hypothetical protein [Candidatus Obscuribacterales bacterium]
MSGSYFSSNGQSVKLGARIGSGGEGHVYECIGQPSLVAKIYHKGVDREHARKLAAMVGICNDKLERIASWPRQTITDGPAGPLVGILMKRFSSDFREIINLYSPIDRKKYFPEADYRFLLHTAWNLVAAFETIHSAGVVIGDVNQKNILVNKDAFIRLIDCDSFQIVRNGEKFRCSVGVADYTPPELQGRDFSQLDRTETHDCFGMAVIIFSLLMMGRHPFAGVSRRTAPIELAQAISGYHFAYGRSGKSLLAPPPNAPPSTLLPDNLLRLFEDSFSEEASRKAKRPSDRDWLAALDQFRKQVLTCSRSEEHAFGSHNSLCPWCEFESRSIIFFRSSSKKQRQKGVSSSSSSCSHGIVFSIKQDLVYNLEALIKNTSRLLSAAGPSPSIAACRPLSDEVISARKKLNCVRLSFGCFLASAAFGLLGSLSIGIAIIFLLWWLYEESDGNEFVKEKQNRLKAFNQAQFAIEQFGSREENLNHLKLKLEGTFIHTHKLLDEYKNFQSRFEYERKQLELNKRSEQEKQFLQKFSLEAAIISDFSVKRKATLRSFGIYSAADLEPNALKAMPGIGPVLSKSLMDWRNSKLANFVYDPNKAVSDSSIEALKIKMKTRYAILESELQARYKRLKTEIEQDYREDLEKLANQTLAVQQLAQSQADMEAVK